MKKKLESELVSIAHRILKLKGKEDVVKMHIEAKELFEKLSILKFVNENFDDTLTQTNNSASLFSVLDVTFKNPLNTTATAAAPSKNTTSPVVNAVKQDEVFEKPQPAKQIEPAPSKAPEIITNVPPEPVVKHEPELEDLPVFEPASQTDATVPATEKKSVNDIINTKRLNIGLNDKIAFVKQLFDGETTDYDRVISQLNTLQTFNDAQNLIKNIVKPDYNNWEGKEEIEERFINIIETKFI